MAFKVVLRALKNSLLVIGIGLLANGLQALSPVFAAEADIPPVTLQSIQLDDAGLHIMLSKPGLSALPQSFVPMRVGITSQYIIELPDTALSPSFPRRLAINQRGVKAMEALPIQSPFYTSVRLTFWLTSPEALDGILASRSSTGDLLIAFPPPATVLPTVLPSPLKPKPESVTAEPLKRITQLRWQKGQLILGVDGADPLNSVSGEKFQTKPLVISRFPSNRLIVDINQATLDLPENAREFQALEPGSPKIRIGQFEPTVVRVVLETPHPERYHIVDNTPETLTISLSTGGSSTPKPVNTASIGDIEDITIKRIPAEKPNEQATTVIRVFTSAPINSTLSKGDAGKLWVDMPGIASRAGTLPIDRQLFPDHIATLKLENLASGGTRLVIHLKSAQVLARLSVSNDKKETSIALSLLEATTTLPQPDKSIKNLSGLQVVVDAGHGGKDVGANRAGVFEKDINLAIALRLKKILVQRGIKVAMTREDDVFLPLPDITAFTNRLSPVLFVSIHTNASTSSEHKGIETYYYTNQSIAWAKTMHQSLTRRIPTPDRSVRQAKFYVIHHTPVPAILCEIGYVSNDSERAALVTDERRQALAEALAEGIINYLNQLAK